MYCTILQEVSLGVNLDMRMLMLLRQQPLSGGLLNLIIWFRLDALLQLCAELGITPWSCVHYSPVKVCMVHLAAAASKYGFGCQCLARPCTMGNSTFHLLPEHSLTSGTLGQRRQCRCSSVIYTFFSARSHIALPQPVFGAVDFANLASIT